MGVEVLIRLTALGDVLLAIPAARALAADRGASVHWVLDQRLQEIAAFLPAKVHLLGSWRDLLPCARRLRRLLPVRVHDLQGKIRARLLAGLLAVPCTRYQKRSLQENLRVFGGGYPLRPQWRTQVWQRYLEVVHSRATGVFRPCSGLDIAGVIQTAVDNRQPASFLRFPDTYSLQVTQPLLAQHGLVHGAFTIIHPEASHPGKVIPAKLLRHLIALLPAPVVLVGTTRQVMVDDPKILDLRGQTTLTQLPGLLATARLVISSDSGPMHLARAVGAPLLALFFQTHPVLGFAPIPGDNVRVLATVLPCQPCSLHGQRSECPEGHWRCRDLDLDAVRDAVHALSSGQKPGSRTFFSIAGSIS